MLGYLKRNGIDEAVDEFNHKPVEKFYNKKYYNPEYHHYMIEGPDVLRLYSERDNSATAHDFSDVLDSVYVNVFIMFNSDDQPLVFLSSFLLWFSLLL